MITHQSSQPSHRAVIFSYHSVGFGERKNSVVFLAESLAQMGWRADLVTVQLSLLSRLARVPRLKVVPRQQWNTWLERTDRISNFVWVPVIHPATSGWRWIDHLATPIFRLYPHLLPQAIRQRVRLANLIVIESCSAVLLYPLLKRLAPNAKFVYRACDSLDAVGMHPVLAKTVTRTACNFDLFSSPSTHLLADLPSCVNKCLLPQGLQKCLFDVLVASPYETPGPHAIVAGDMMFDLQSFKFMVRNFPNVTFHVFGKMDLSELASFDNLIRHGEVPFETLRSYIVHADLGIAPYLDRPEVHYLAESSLKLVQYTYAQLPILAPNFCESGRDHLKVYVPGEESSIVRAMKQALLVDRQTIDRSGIYDWEDVAREMLSKVDLLTGPA